MAAVPVAALALLLYVIGGPVVLALPALLLAAAWQPQRIGLAAFGAMTVAGVLTATAAHPAAHGTGAFGSAAQVCALIALAVPLTPRLPAWPRRAAPGGLPVARFGVVDELTCWYDSPAEPANVHIEAWLHGRLDDDLFRASVLAVLAERPRARVRRRPGRAWRVSSRWEYPVAPDDDPVRVITTSEPDQADWRAGVLSASPSLDRSPPMRFWLVHGVGGDKVLLNAHHAALDGLSCLELLRSVAAAYRGDILPGSANLRRGAGLRGSASLRRGAGLRGSASLRRGARLRGSASLRRDQECHGDLPEAPVAGARRIGGSWLAGRALPRLPRAAVRITRCLDPGQPRGLHGYGTIMVIWDGLDAAVGQLRATGSSVNDLLIAAMIATVSRWNASAGRPAPAAGAPGPAAGRPGRVRITMPIGDRDMASGCGELGHTSRLAAVTAPAWPTSSPADLIELVSAQTRQAKLGGGAQLDPLSQILGAPLLPIPIRRWLLRTGLRIAGSRLCDTCLVSNLGAIEPPEFGPAAADAVWFSTSAHMPRGLSLGAVTVRGRLHLTFRYRCALLGDGAAARFAQQYLDLLDGFAGRQPGNVATPPEQPGSAS